MISITNEKGIQPYRLRAEISGEGTFEMVLDAVAAFFKERPEVDIASVKMEVAFDDDEVAGMLYYQMRSKGKF